MTISSENRKAGPFVGNNVTVNFPFTFKVFTEDDLYVVTALTSSGEETALVISDDYTVTLNVDQDVDPGGTVTLPVPLASGYTLIITSVLEYLQPTELTNLGGFYPRVINDALDRLTIFCQQLYEQITRSIKISLSTPDGFDTTLPPPVAGGLIGWNGDANGFENVDPSTLATLVAYGTANADIFSGTGAQTLFTLSDNPGSLENLDVSISGATQKPGVDYFWTSGTSLLFASAPPLGTSNILVRYMRGLPLGYGSVTKVASFAALASTSGSTGDVVYLTQHTSAGEGGDYFAWKSGSITNDLGTQINSATGGHWERVNYPVITPQSFGAAVDGTTDSTSSINALNARKAFAITHKQSYQYGQLTPALGAFMEYNNATIGTTEKLTNGTFTGSATGWTLSNFTYSANTITHTAGSIGTATQSITLKPFRNYLLTVVLTTTTRGGVDFQADGSTLLDDTGYYTFDPATGTYIFNYLNYTPTAVTFRVITDINWAGSIDSISLIEVQTDYPFAYYGVPTDDPTFRNPQGIKFGRYNAGNIAIGDKQTMAMGGISAVWNIAIGPRALSSNVSAFENTAVGAFAGKYTTTDRNSFYGYSAGKYNTLGTALTCIGYKAGVLNTTGVRNTSLGYHAQFQNTSGSDNVAAGFQALYSALNTSYNTAIGSQTAQNCIGSSNTYVGALAGILNVSVGITYSYSNGTMIGAETRVYGENGTALGYNASVGADGAPQNNAAAIGANTTNRLASSTKIGNSQNVTTLSGVLRARQTFSANTSAAGATLTAAQFFSSVLERSGPAAPFSDTTPSAASLIALVGGPEVGIGYDIYYRNLSSQAMTLIAGSGITLGGTTTVAAGKARLYKVQFTNVGAGTETATIYGVALYDN